MIPRSPSWSSRRCNRRIWRTLSLSSRAASFCGRLPSSTNAKHLSHYTLGLMSDLKRKSIEPIALASGVAVRTLQEFLSHVPWDHGAAQRLLVRQVAGDHAAVQPGPVNAHDKRHHAVDLLGRFLLVRFDITGRVSPDHQVVAVPSQNWIAAVPDLLAEYKVHQFLGRCAHGAEALAEGHH